MANTKKKYQDVAIEATNWDEISRTGADDYIPVESSVKQIIESYEEWRDNQ